MNNEPTFKSQLLSFPAIAYIFQIVTKNKLLPFFPSLAVELEGRRIRLILVGGAGIEASQSCFPLFSTESSIPALLLVKSVPRFLFYSVLPV